MIKVGELTYLYRLKESKEYRYYKLVPWVREARIVRGLPSSFQYWKFWFFFVSGDECLLSSTLLLFSSSSFF